MSVVCTGLSYTTCLTTVCKVATDDSYRLQFASNGKEQLKTFDNYQQRAEKLVEILEAMSSERKR